MVVYRTTFVIARTVVVPNVYALVVVPNVYALVACRTMFVIARTIVVLNLLYLLHVPVLAFPRAPYFM